MAVGSDALQRKRSFFRRNIRAGTKPRAPPKPQGVPPALPGRQQKFDISGGRHRRPSTNSNREQPSTRRGVPSMDDYESLSHSKWECKYHVVFIPKCRRKTLYLELRRHLGDVFRKLAEQKESRIEEGHLLLDHVHMLISIPPKYAVSQVIGFSRERVRYTWLVYTERRSGILWPAWQGILRIHSRTGHRGNTRVHQEAGRGGQAPGTDESVALMSHLQVAHTFGAASGPVSRFERLIT